jgi:hypothetical protein
MRLRVARKVVIKAADPYQCLLWYKESTRNRAAARWLHRIRDKRWKTLECGCRVLWWHTRFGRCWGHR